MRKTKRLFVLVTALFLVCASVVYAWESEAAKDWANRDSSASVEAAIKIYEAALAENESDENLLVRLSQAYYWKGNDKMPGGSKDVRMAAYQKGMEYAKKAIAVNSKSIGGHFWYATNLASEGREVGIVKSASKLPELKKHMEIVTAQSPYYFQGGPQRFYARIITKAPAFLRKTFGYKLEDAEKMLKEAISKYPDFSMNYLFLADVYIEMGKKDLAAENLKKLLSLNASKMPQYAAELRRDKRVAKKRLAVVESGN